jgi:hypothetical protein
MHINDRKEVDELWQLCITDFVISLLLIVSHFFKKSPTPTSSLLLLLLLLAEFSFLLSSPASATLLTTPLPFPIIGLFLFSPHLAAHSGGSWGFSRSFECVCMYVCLLPRG